MRGLIALIGLLLLPFAAAAADLRMPVKAQPIVAPIPSWAGAYLGLHAGYTIASAEGDYTGVQPPPPMSFYTFDLKPSGAALGGQFGYNAQYGAWLFGVEGDLSWIVSGSDLIWDPAGSPRFDEIELFWTAHARGRIGYVAGGSMIYLAGGAAFAGVRATHQGPVGASSATWFDSRTLTGFSLGGGFETFFAPNWIFRAEYLYDRFGNERYDWAPDSRYSNSDLTLNTVRLGVIYRP